ncbi:ParB/RepB/Spo0J family partition protein [bacterium]|nr:ParB/RepB/Spo0J family partition protein [bacterium]
MQKKRMALGKGLNALLQDAEREVRKENEQADSVNKFNDIPLKYIEPNPNQPRVEFDEDLLEELSQSIKVHGLIQPITVRQVGRNKYQIISGERRYRASLLAGIESVPAYVREADDQTTLEMALIENIQREDLNAMEVANSYRRLIDECNLNQEELGNRVGKKRSTVTNYLRLLKLPSELQIALRANLIKMGHARALIVVDDPERQKSLLEDILENDYSVRQVERLVKEILDGPVKEEKSAEPATKNISEKKPDYNTLLWEEKFSKACNRNVKIKLKPNGKGEILLPFTNESELENFLQQLS